MRLKNNEYWDVPAELANRMLEVARDFRKEPTPSENVLWEALRGRKLAQRKFKRQVPIGAFIVDFFCASERLIVEVDGLIHETQYENDKLRQEMIESLGIRFVRITASQVENNLPQALLMIQSAFQNQ
jgi:very-short-patch-repair endonuclease